MEKRMKIPYDHNGLGITEMTALAFSHPVLFSLVFWMTQHNLEKMALKITRFLV
jgi:hypothetical protein